MTTTTTSDSVSLHTYSPSSFAMCANIVDCLCKTRELNSDFILRLWICVLSSHFTWPTGCGLCLKDATLPILLSVSRPTFSSLRAPLQFHILSAFSALHH